MVADSTGGQESSGIAIAELRPELLREAGALLAAYRHPAGWGEREHHDCTTTLERLLDFGMAGFLLARRGEDYAGFISLNWGFSTTTGKPILRVQDLFTLPQCRRAGVARALLEHARRLGEARGANRLQLETDGENAQARALYQSLGFEWFPRKAVYMRFL